MNALEEINAIAPDPPAGEIRRDKAG